MLLAGTASICVAMAEPIEQWVMTRRVPTEFDRRGHQVRGYESYKRFVENDIKHGTSKYYYKENGLKAGESIRSVIH